MQNFSRELILKMDKQKSRCSSEIIVMNECGRNNWGKERMAYHESHVSIHPYLPCPAASHAMTNAKTCLTHPEVLTLPSHTELASKKTCSLADKKPLQNKISRPTQNSSQLTCSTHSLHARLQPTCLELAFRSSFVHSVLDGRSLVQTDLLHSVLEGWRDHLTGGVVVHGAGREGAAVEGRGTAG